MNYQNEDHLDLRQKKSPQASCGSLGTASDRTPLSGVVGCGYLPPCHGTPHHLLRAFQRQTGTAALSPGGAGTRMCRHLPASGSGPQPPGISADSCPKCLSVLCSAPDSVPGLPQQRRRHPRSNSGSVCCRGTLPSAFRTPLSGSLPAGGSGSRRPLLCRSHALSDPLVALQRAPLPASHLLA